VIGAAREPGARFGFLRRRRNRRVTSWRPTLAEWAADAFARLVQRLLVVGKVLAGVVFLAGAAWGGQRAVRHVIASPRFALREIRVSAAKHVLHDEVVALAAVSEGDALLAVDTDAVAARVASHPWVASARVRRELPSALVVDVVERRASAVGLLGALYLLDDAGHPFKRATLDEAVGLPVLTGVAREQYTAHRAATEAAFREALDILARYQAPGKRPALSEVHIDPRFGFSLVLLEGGGEILLGRGHLPEKLARLDQILVGVGPGGAARVRTVHLEGDSYDRVAIKLEPSPLSKN
jgi:cell division protein FtsQ